jgi:isoleucyl-tRNA synthetase
VCINPDLNYALVKKDNAFIIIAEEMVASCNQRWNSEMSTISVAKGSEFGSIKLVHPFVDRNSYLLEGDHVTTEAGTGCVHTAPAHGLDDFNVCKKNNIEVYKALNARALFTSDFDFIEGLPPLKADEKIIQKLNEVNALISVEDYDHSYPHCWRHKTPLIFTATAQWFISMDKANLLSDAQGAVDTVKWEPSWGLQRINSMLKDRPDWCISRQRNWGVPITLVIHKETGEIHPNQDKLFIKFADLIEKEGISSWNSLDLSTFIDDHDEYIKVTDSLDVWFDSGVTHSAVTDNRFGAGTVADLYLEGSDQHRGWFQSSLLTSMAMNNRAPYKSVLTHGFVVDENGRKQSKSLGNVVSPQKVWDSLGADILRLWVASTDFRSEMVASDEILKRVSDQYRRIRNTLRFVLGNLNDFSKKDSIEMKDQVELDKWIINATKSLEKNVIRDYENYSYHTAVQKIHNFCVNELGGIYLDIVKDRLYTTGKNSHARRSCQTSLDYICNILVRLIAPILSYTAEEIWQTHPSLKEQGESIFLNTYGYKETYNEVKITSENWSRIFEIKDLVNQSIEKMRSENNIKGSLDSIVTLHLEDEDYSLLQKIGKELHFIFISTDAQIKKADSFSIEISVSEDPKCSRCWHRCKSVGTIEGHEEACSRCIENIENDGELRHFV